MPDTPRVRYEVRASDVLNAVFDPDYRIPKPSAFRQQLSEKKIHVMPVAYAEKGDYVTEDMDGFLNYVRLNGIKTVMFAHLFYSVADIEAHFRVSSADRAFFRKYPSDEEQRFLNRQHGLPEPQNMPDDFSQYQLYCQYVQAAVDLDYPKLVSLYAIHGGKVITCTLADEWLDRLPLPDAKSIREACLKSASYSGDIDGLLSFQFIYDTADSDGLSQCSTSASVDEISHKSEISPLESNESIPDSVEIIPHESEILPLESNNSVPDSVKEISHESDFLRWNWTNPFLIRLKKLPMNPILLR